MNSREKNNRKKDMANDDDVLALLTTKAKFVNGGSGVEEESNNEMGSIDDQIKSLEEQAKHLREKLNLSINSSLNGSFKQLECYKAVIVNNNKNQTQKADNNIFMDLDMNNLLVDNQQTNHPWLNGQPHHNHHNQQHQHQIISTPKQSIQASQIYSNDQQHHNAIDFKSDELYLQQIK